MPHSLIAVLGEPRAAASMIVGALKLTRSAIETVDGIVVWDSRVTIPRLRVSLEYASIIGAIDETTVRTARTAKIHVIVVRIVSPCDEPPKNDVAPLPLGADIVINDSGSIDDLAFATRRLALFIDNNVT